MLGDGADDVRCCCCFFQLFLHSIRGTSSSGSQLFLRPCSLYYYELKIPIMTKQRAQQVAPLMLINNTRYILQMICCTATAAGVVALLLGGAILNTRSRTYGRDKTYQVYRSTSTWYYIFSIFTNNIWFYLLWSPVTLLLLVRNIRRDNDKMATTTTITTNYSYTLLAALMRWCVDVLFVVVAHQLSPP